MYQKGIIEKLHGEFTNDIKNIQEYTVPIITHHHT